MFKLNDNTVVSVANATVSAANAATPPAPSTPFSIALRRGLLGVAVLLFANTALGQGGSVDLVAPTPNVGSFIRITTTGVGTIIPPIYRCDDDTLTDPTSDTNKCQQASTATNGVYPDFYRLGADDLMHYMIAYNSTYKSAYRGPILAQAVPFRISGSNHVGGTVRLDLDAGVTGVRLFRCSRNDRTSAHTLTSDSNCQNIRSITTDTDYILNNRNWGAQFLYLQRSSDKATTPAFPASDQAFLNRLELKMGGTGVEDRLNGNHRVPVRTSSDTTPFEFRWSGDPDTTYTIAVDGTNIASGTPNSTANMECSGAGATNCKLTVNASQTQGTFLRTAADKTVTITSTRDGIISTAGTEFWNESQEGLQVRSSNQAPTLQRIVSVLAGDRDDVTSTTIGLAAGSTYPLAVRITDPDTGDSIASCSAESSNTAVATVAANAGDCNFARFDVSVPEGVAATMSSTITVTAQDDAATPAMNTLTIALTVTPSSLTLNTSTDNTKEIIFGAQIPTITLTTAGIEGPVSYELLDGTSGETALDGNIGLTTTPSGANNTTVHVGGTSNQPSTTFRVKATGLGTQEAVSTPITITVRAGSDRPTLLATAGQCVVDDDDCTLTVTAEGGSGNLTLGTAPTGTGTWMTVGRDTTTPNTGVAIITGRPPNTTGSPFTLGFTITDFGGRETNINYTVNVVERGLTHDSTNNGALSQDFMSVTAIDAIALTAVGFASTTSITYTLVGENNDDTFSNGSLAVAGNNSATATVSGMPSGLGRFVFRVKAVSGSDTGYSSPITITVNNDPQVADGDVRSLTLTAGGRGGNLRRVDFTDMDTSMLASAFTCTAESSATGVATVPTTLPGAAKGDASDNIGLADRVSCLVLVTAVARGEATITVRLTDGIIDPPIERQFTVTVIDRLENLNLQVGAANRTVQATVRGERYSVVSSDSAFATATVNETTGEVTIRPLSAGTTTITISACDEGHFTPDAVCDSNHLPHTQFFTVTVSEPAPAESSSGSSGGVVVILAAAGAYLWWKNRQIANGNAAAMALLPDVSFDLDKKDNRAFYTKMKWKNLTSSAWQLSGNATMHTKYDGELLDWKADSHIGYRWHGKWGNLNPYTKAKFVADDPQNEAMDETYTVGVNYAMPNRFDVQFLQPDDEIWRYSVKTKVQLPRGVSLQLNQPNSDIWRYSANINWKVSERVGLQLAQPNSDLENYSVGLQWHGDSKIRYGLSTEIGAHTTYRMTGSYSF